MPGARVLMKVAGAGRPLLVERRIGQGTVLLFASTADRDWTDFPAHPAFPVLLNEAVTYLTTRDFDRSFTVGEPLVVPVAGQGAETNVLFRDPDGKERPVQVTERDGRRAARFEPADLPGFYGMALPGREPSVLLAVNVDPVESDIRVLREPEFTAALKGLPVRLLPESEDVRAAIEQSRVGRELWRVPMVLGLAVLVIEAFLAHRFSKRMMSSAFAP
jgi:hypothetical protein